MTLEEMRSRAQLHFRIAQEHEDAECHHAAEKARAIGEGWEQTIAICERLEHLEANR